MHEVSIARRVLDVALEVSREHGGARVRVIRLALGDLTCLEPDTLSFALDVLARGSVAERCRLEVTRVGLVLRCRGCGEEHGGDLLTPCPRCGVLGGDVQAGREMRIESVDLAGPDDPPEDDPVEQEEGA